MGKYDGDWVHFVLVDEEDYYNSEVLGIFECKPAAEEYAMDRIFEKKWSINCINQQRGYGNVVEEIIYGPGSFYRMRIIEVPFHKCKHTEAEIHGRM